MKIITSLALIAILAGCATATETKGPSGSKAFFVKCGSAVMSACYEKAAEVCPKGYAIVDNQGNPNAFINATGSTAMVVRGPNQLFIECKGE
jgi:hypothetical protein